VRSHFVEELEQEQCIAFVYPVGHSIEQVLIEGDQLSFDALIDLAGIRDQLLDVRDKILAGDAQVSFNEEPNQLFVNEHRAVLEVQQKVFVHNREQWRVLCCNESRHQRLDERIILFHFNANIGDSLQQLSHKEVIFLVELGHSVVQNDLSRDGVLRV